MKIAHTVAFLATGLLVMACADAPTVPDPLLDEWHYSEVGAANRVIVMTQNLYVGADVDAVLTALLTPDPLDDVSALLTAIETVQKTDFPTRAAAIADAIAQERPHVVGVQEVSDIFIDLTALGLDIVFSQRFMPILEAALAERGLSYVLADSILNFTAAPVPGVTLTDYDAILVDTERATIDFTYRQHFSDNLDPVAPGVELKRGLVEVAATIEGRRYYFVNTHLEPDIAGMDLSGLRARLRHWKWLSPSWAIPRRRSSWAT